MRATAFVIGPPDGQADIARLARRLNFDRVLPYGGISLAEQQVNLTPLCFFLFAGETAIDLMRNIADSIRFNPSKRLRFSPLVYLPKQASLEMTKICIDMGFDDVISMPHTRARLTERMERQVGQSLIYFETAEYFGPDRRGRMGSAPPEARANGTEHFRRLEIVRNPQSGIQVVRDESFV